MADLVCARAVIMRVPGEVYPGFTEDAEGNVVFKLDPDVVTEDMVWSVYRYTLTLLLMGSFFFISDGGGGLNVSTFFQLVKQFKYKFLGIYVLFGKI